MFFVYKAYVFGFFSLFLKVYLYGYLEGREVNMRKKIFMLFILLFGTFSIAYAGLRINQNMNAASQPIGGKVYGKLGGPSIGDRVYLGAKSNLGLPMGWVLVQEYAFNNSYLAFSTSSMDKTTLYNSTSDIPTLCHKVDPNDTAFWKSFDSFNAKLDAQDRRIVSNRSYQWYQSFLNSSSLQTFINNSTYGLPALQNLNVGIDDSGSTIPPSDRSAAKSIVTLVNNFKHAGYGITNNGGSISAIKGAYPYTGQVEVSSSRLFCTLPICPNVTFAAQPSVNPMSYNLNVDGKQFSTFVGNFWAGVFQIQITLRQTDSFSLIKVSEVTVVYQSVQLH